jgi:hypothetical protein
MIRLVFAEFRDAKFMIGWLIGGVTILMVILSLILPSQASTLSLGVTSMFLTYAPLCLLVGNAKRQSTKLNRLATLASLPITSSTLSLSQYGTAILVQICGVSTFLFVNAFSPFNISNPIEVTIFALNFALLGVGLMAIGLLALDIFQRLAPLIGGLIWFSVLVFPQTSIFFWTWKHFGESQFLMLVAAVVFLLVSAEIYIFSRQRSFV